MTSLTGDAGKARPETVVRLLEDLLAACDSPGGLAAALERGTAIAFLEELSLRTTPKRRRVEIATVALRGIAAEADRGLYDFDEEREAAAVDEADAVPPPPAQITPPIAAVAVAQQAAVAVAPALPAVVPHPSLKVVPPVAPEVLIRPTHDATSHQFDRLREAVKERDEAAQSRFDVAKLLEWLRELDWRKVAAVGVPTVLVVAWWLWPAGLLRLPPRPKQYDPVPFAAIPLVPGWADIDRLGRAPRRAATPVAVADERTRSTANDARPASRAAAIVAEPPADASVALVPPAGSVPTAPVAAAPPRLTLPAPAETRPVAEPSRASGSEGTDGETVYSWTSQGVEPPVIRSPNMPSWAMPPAGRGDRRSLPRSAGRPAGAGGDGARPRPDRAGRDVLPASHDAGVRQALAVQSGAPQRTPGALRDPRDHRTALTGPHRAVLTTSGTSRAPAGRARRRATRSSCPGRGCAARSAPAARRSLAPAAAAWR